MTNGRMRRSAAWLGVAAGLCGTVAHAGAVGVVAVDGCAKGTTAPYAAALRDSLSRRDGRVMTAEDTIQRVGGAPRGTIAEAERLLASARFDVFDEAALDRAERTLLTAIDDLRTLPASDARWQDLREAHTLLAFLYVRQEKKELAEATLAKALAVEPKLQPSADLYPPSFRGFVDEVRKKVAKRATATLRVTTHPAGTPVYVDGREVGRSPLIMKLPAGRYRVEADFGTEAFIPRTVELKDEGSVDLRKDFEGQLHAARGPCLGTDGSREGRLRAMVRLASFLGADELVGVREEEPAAGERFVVATVVDARTGQETREGKIKVRGGTGADTSSIGRLAEFLSTGAAVPPVEVALGGRPVPASAVTPAPAPAQPASAPLAVTTQPAPSASAAVPAAPAVTQQARGSGSVLRPVGYVSAGVGVAALGVGGFFFAQANDTAREVETYRDRDGTIPEADRERVNELNAQRDEQQSRAMIAAGVGAAALTAGVVLFFLGGDEAPDSTQAFVLTPTANGVRVQF